MSGTWASYQGFPCAAVRFRRSRGYSSDTIQVVIPLPQFPAGFDWKAAAKELDSRPTREIPERVAAGLEADTPLTGLQLAAGLSYEGTLVLAEDADRIIAVPGLLVTRVESESVDDEGGVALVTLTLADERLFWPLGILRRWRWNVLQLDGTYSRDTIRRDGTAYPLAEVAAEVAAGIWRKPKLERTPAAWAELAREVETEPFPGAVEVLARLVGLGQAASPSLHLDGSVAIYSQGEGQLGWAENGVGINAREIPPGVISEEDGAGIGATREATWPPEWIVVTGRERIATMALDDWEPVIMIEGRPFLLSEELVRYLTGGKPETVVPENNRQATIVKISGGRYGLEWLKAWIMLPNADQGAEGVGNDVLILFRDQAWNYYRMPGVEKHEGGFYTGEQGRNAHLLPILDRAETSRGQRLPPTVQASRWETKRRQFSATEEQSALRLATQQMLKIQEAVVTALIQDAEGSNPIGRDETVTRFGAEFFAPVAQTPGLTLTQMMGGKPIPDGVDHGGLAAAMREYRVIQKLREKGQEALASEYERALEAKIKAQDALGYEELADTYEAAKKLVEFETKAAQGVVSAAGLYEDFRRFYGQVVATLLERLGRKRRLSQRQRDADLAAGRPKGKLISAVFLSNTRRAPDAGARVVSADLGIVRTSARSGHADPFDVPDPSLSRFVPRPVRVLFGSRLRPRIDANPSDFVRTRTRGDVEPTPEQQVDAGLSIAQQLLSSLTGDLGFGDYVPAVLGDDESYYAAAFRRTGPGKVVRVELNAVPWDRAQPVRRRWQELVPLTGVTNRPQLDEEAAKLAAGIASPPDRIASARYVLVGPWPIQCDGVVSAVEIVSESKDGGICGFTTRVAIGGEATVAPLRSQERVRGQS